MVNATTYQFTNDLTSKQSRLLFQVISSLNYLLIFIYKCTHRMRDRFETIIKVEPQWAVPLQCGNLMRLQSCQQLCGVQSGYSGYQNGHRVILILTSHCTAVLVFISMTTICEIVMKQYFDSIFDLEISQTNFVPCFEDFPNKFEFLAIQRVV